MRMTSDVYPEMITARAQDELRELELRRRRHMTVTSQRRTGRLSWTTMLRRLVRQIR
jgi:hypothetical protein